MSRKKDVEKRLRDTEKSSRRVRKGIEKFKKELLKFLKFKKVTNLNLERASDILLREANLLTTLGSAVFSGLLI